MTTPLTRLEAFEWAIFGCTVQAPESSELLRHLERNIQSGYVRFFEPSLDLLGILSSTDRIKTALQVLNKVSRAIRDHRNPEFSIDDVVKILGQGSDESLPEAQISPESCQTLRLVVFACIGYLTCLYTPAISAPEDVLALDIPRLGCVPVTSIKSNLASRRIQGMLKNFGELFPEHSKQNHDGKTIYSSRLNFYSLHRFSNIQIKWVDILAAHLDFNSSTKELLLFRLPNFCLLHSRRGEKASIFHEILREYNSSVLPGRTTKTSTQNYLNEVILSYRVIFGNDSRSRHIFNSVEKVRAGTDGVQDSFLSKLCGKPKVNVRALNVPYDMTNRTFYDFEEDFPLLGERLLRLQEFNMRQDSSTLREFWSDRRNPFNFWTFWAVIVVGVISICLSIIQCGLSIAQLVVSIRQG